MPQTTNTTRLPLKPLRGSLFKRKGGKYLPVSSQIEAPFWFEFRLPGDGGRIHRIALHTTDPALALLRADELVFRSRQFAEEAMLRLFPPSGGPGSVPAASTVGRTAFGQPDGGTSAAREPLPLAPSGVGRSPSGQDGGAGASPPSVPQSGDGRTAFGQSGGGTSAAREPPPIDPSGDGRTAFGQMRIPLSRLWETVKARYEARAKSLEAYRQQTAKFVKYALRAGLRYVDEVTRPFAEDYARWLYPRVTTADKHIGCLRREWQLLFPDAPTNPWNLSIRLQQKEKARAMNYRALTLNEIRRVRQAIARLRLDKSSLGSRGRMLNDAILADMADAVVFCYRYGLRIGSVDVIRWKDFNFAEKTFCHRPPKTSRATLGNDYPILPEIEAILDRRRSGSANHPTGLLFSAFAKAHTSAEQMFNLAIKAVFKFARVEDSPLKGRASWHSLRATFITRLTENGCPVAIVKELAQHAKADVTQRYVHISMGVKLSWLKTLPDLGGIDLSADYQTETELVALQ